MRSGVWKTIQNILLGGVLAASFVVFVLWRTDNPRLQQVRMATVDAVAPTLERIAGPSSAVAEMFDEVRSYSDLQSENERLRREVERLKLWVEIARQREEENARLRALNAVKPAPRETFVTAEVIADSGGPFAESVLVNVGRRDGVLDGAPARDAAGLLGRVAGSGERSARVLLLTDPTSRVPVAIGENRVRAILQGDNTEAPTLQFLEKNARIEAGARIATSGSGGVYPIGLHVGRVLSLPSDEGPARVALAADFRRLAFLRIRRIDATPESPPAGGLILRAPGPDEGASSGATGPQAAVDAGN
ncbi:MAG: rod shape-determining protein MreC [Pseudomonadota bacterium]